MVAGVVTTTSVSATLTTVAATSANATATSASNGPPVMVTLSPPAVIP